MYFVAVEKINGAVFMMLDEEDLKRFVKPIGVVKSLQHLQRELKEKIVRMMSLKCIYAKGLTPINCTHMNTSI